MKKYTVIYTVPVGNYGNLVVRMARLTQHDHETLVQAINRVGYETQPAGYEYDIMDSVVFIFDGHPALEGEGRHVVPDGVAWSQVTLVDGKHVVR